MLLAIRNAVARFTASGNGVIFQIVTGKVSFRSAGRSRVIAAVTGIVLVNLTGCAAMILTIAIGMAIYPARFCPVMVKAIAYVVALNAAARRYAFCQSQRSNAEKQTKRKD